MKTYTITFDDQVMKGLTEAEVINFIQVAMFRNKDISKATIKRED